MEEQFKPNNQNPEEERNLAQQEQDPAATANAASPAKASAKPGWKRWLNYQSVVKQVPFFLFLSLLAVLYIYNGHHADKTIRKINKLSKEVKELKYEYTAVKSKVLYQSKQSELFKAVEPLGLKELVKSPVTLKPEMNQ